MMRSIQLVFVTVTLAACGGKAPPPAAQPATAPTAAAAPADAAPAPATSSAPASAGDDQAKADALAAENAAYAKAKPVFDKYCASCHTKGGARATVKKLSHVDMTTYPFGGMHTKSIGNEVRKVLGLDGGKPTMPYGHPGAVKGDDLAAIAAWTEAWRAAGKAGAHPADPADNDDD